MRAGRIAGYGAFGAALTYVLLKVAWIAGSSFGIRDLGGVSRADWVSSNIVTGGLGVVGAVVALATVRPWGRRIPSWLIAVPMWVGTGLLAPFVILIPAAAVFTAAGWWTPPSATAPDGAEPILAPWTFAIVYGSFMVLGVGLAVALPVYARARFRTAVSGTVGQAPAGPTQPAQAPLAWAAVVLALGLAAVRLAWAFGGTIGLRPEPRDAWLRLGDAVTATQVLCAALGVLVLVYRWGKHLPFALPLVATWLGAGGLVGRGGLGMLTILSGDQWAPAGETYVAHATGTFFTCVVGALISIVALFLLVERAAAIRQAAARRPPVAAVG